MDYSKMSDSELLAEARTTYDFMEVDKMKNAAKSEEAKDELWEEEKRLYHLEESRYEEL